MRYGIRQRIRRGRLGLGGAPVEVAYRVSCGDGSAVTGPDGLGNWESDNPSSYVSGDTGRVANGLTWSFAGSVPAYMRLGALCQEERFAATGDMTWTFDMTGYAAAVVRVMVGETFFQVDGAREFSASVNGVTLFTDLDPHAALGDRGIAAVYAATVAPDVNDEAVITFARGAANNPQVLAIEVRGI